MVNGKYALPEKPGLGFDLTEDALKKYRLRGAARWPACSIGTAPSRRGSGR
jgi:hypothetical protein